jgi:hypothetical protein
MRAPISAGAIGSQEVIMWKSWIRWHDSLAPVDGAGVAGDAAAAPPTPADHELAREIADGELTARHAVRLRLAVAESDLVLLIGARAHAEALRQDEARQCDFFAALRRVAAAGVPPAGELRALEQRVQRLQPELRHAQQLLYFAAARGKVVDDALAKPLVEAIAAAEAGSISEAQELGFLVTYRRLAAEMAPVSGATLVASQQRIPRLADLFMRPRQFLDDLAHMTLGRFVHFALFTLVLLAAGVAIAYQTVGEAAFARHQSATQRIESLQAEHARARATERDRQYAMYTLIERKQARGDEVAQADIKLHESIAEVARLAQAREDALAERDTLSDTLRAWTSKPCDWAALKWSCGLAVNGSGPATGARAIVFDAEMALQRMNQIVLPMLLGLLGAYSFVLRTVSREIRERSFAAQSALHQVARLALGALAGVAVGWLIKPEQIGLLSSVPTWVMAFVAGYGIEIVFAFMDRLVGAFANKQSANA